MSSSTRKPVLQGFLHTGIQFALVFVALFLNNVTVSDSSVYHVIVPAAVGLSFVVVSYVLFAWPRQRWVARFCSVALFLAAAWTIADGGFRMRWW